jgi:hypothetical protein
MAAMSFLRFFYILALFLSSAAVVAQADDADHNMQDKDELTWHGVNDAHDQQMLKEADKVADADNLEIQKEIEQMPQAIRPQSQQAPDQMKETLSQPKKGPHQDIAQQKDLKTDQEHPESNYSEFSIAPETSYISYRESVHSSTFMKEKGVMSGINGSYTIRPSKGDNLHFDDIDVYRFDARFDYGKVSYDGSNNFKGIDDYMLELRGLMGKDFDFNHDSIRLTPYSGIGYRSLYDSFYEDKQVNGYNRWIQYVYIPMGAEVMARIKDGWAIGADAEYDFFTYGRVTSYTGQIGLGDLVNTQKHGYGLRGSFKLEKMWSRYNFILEPYIRYWHIHNSHVQQSTPFVYNGQYYVIVAFEPDNTSEEIGARLTIEF